MDNKVGKGRKIRRTGHIHKNTHTIARKYSRLTMSYGEKAKIIEEVKDWHVHSLIDWAPGNRYLGKFPRTN